MSRATLFIGGVADGSFFPIPDGVSTMKASRDLPSVGRPTKFDDYRIETLVAGDAGGEYRLAIEANLPTSEAVGRLISFYRPQAEAGK